MTERVRDTADDRKKLVERGYDRLAKTYATARTKLSRRDAQYLATLTARLSPGATVLDLGCGSGTGITQALAERYAVIGVDLSRKQLENARRFVPDGTFVRGDMTEMEFRPGSFDAVTSFVAIIHVPREEHRALFRRIHRWLKPGGLLLVSLGTDDWVSTPEDRFMGVPMYWSQFDARTGRRIVREAGFRIVRSSIERSVFQGEPEEHLYVLAAKARLRRAVSSARRGGSPSRGARRV